MAHLYSRRSTIRNSSELFYGILCVLIIIALIVPWMLPSRYDQTEPVNSLKKITIFPMELEWEYIYRYESPSVIDEPTILMPSDSDDVAISDSYFPLKAGNKWVYERTRTGGMMTPDQVTVTQKTIEIIDSSEFRGTTIYHAEVTDNGSKTMAYYYWDEDGLKRTTDPDRPFRTPVLVLKNNPTVGDEWMESASGGAINSVVKKETVTVPLGEFESILIEHEYGKSLHTRYFTWYTKGIGIISQRHGVPAKGVDEWLLTDFSSN